MPSSFTTSSMAANAKRAFSAASGSGCPFSVNALVSASRMRFVRKATSSDAKAFCATKSEKCWRTARLRHWLDTRARRVPPNNASLGAPVSSRFRFEGAKFCKACISIKVFMRRSPPGKWVPFLIRDSYSDKNRAPMRSGCVSGRRSNTTSPLTRHRSQSVVP